MSKQHITVHVDATTIKIINNGTDSIPYLCILGPHSNDVILKWMKPSEGSDCSGMFIDHMHFTFTKGSDRIKIHKEYITKIGGMNCE